jgi:hypothetical protein
MLAFLDREEKVKEMALTPLEQQGWHRSNVQFSDLTWSFCGCRGWLHPLKVHRINKTGLPELYHDHVLAMIIGKSKRRFGDVTIRASICRLPNLN